MSSIHSDSSQSGTTAFPLELCKPKVALVIDARNWAFHNSARQLQKHLSDRFDVTILSVLDVGEIHRVLMLTADYDLVHFFWRAHLAHLVSEEGRRGIEALGLDSDAFLEDFAHRVSITSGVFDHLFLDPPLPFLQDISNAFVAFNTVYSVSSLKLDNIYRNLPGYGPPRAVLQDGVDLQLFKPQRLHRLVEPPRRKLVVGWVGNSAWGEDTEDFKGVHTILRPAIDELVAKGFPIELMLSDRQNGVIPHSEMPQFYGCIDVYVCVSKFEGTPNPILEAMACGLAVISTDVGIVREAFGTLQTEFILEHRSVLHLQTALTRLLVEPALLKRLSDENLDSIKCWDWRLKAAAYGRFFDAAIELRLAREPMGRMTPVVASEQPYTGFLSGEDSMWRHLDDECSQNESVVAPIVDAEWLKENVVVCMLFFNKLEQTIESAESFLAAGVRLHLLDNGSTPSAAEYLRAHFADHPRVRIVAASSNKGVSGGRNMQLHDTQEPWLFYIDNDITVATPDWLERMAVAIQSNPQAQIFVPRLFNKHEDSWSPMSDFVVDQEGHCVFVATEADYANAYPGGASLIARAVLEQLGGYDERLFVGFEDFELALRAWRRGSPLLVRYVEDIVLIHDHRASVSNADKETAKVRYDQGHISHSHEMIRSTHGVLLNPNFGDWG